MARKKKKKKFEMPTLFGGLREETVHGIWAVFFFVLAVFFGLSAFNVAGVVGDWVYRSFNGLFGVGYYLLPILFMMLAITYTGSLREHIGGIRAFGATVFFVSALALIDLVFEKGGGFVGSKISGPLESLFDKATIVILSALVLVSVLILFDLRFSFDPLRKIGNIFSRKKKEEDYKDEELYDDYEDAGKEIEDEEEEYEEEDDEEYEDEEEGEEEEPKKKGFGINIFNKKESTDAESDAGFRIMPTGDAYVPPPLSLLAKEKGKPDVGDVKASANLIKRTFSNFGIDVEMDEVSMGPTITRFALRPAEGVRLTRITQLQKELELALAAKTVRIEAPIPGKPLVGIEVPNRSTATVRLGNILASPKFKNASKPLIVALGRDTDGETHFADLAAMPHCLVAGTTGSGKSVMMHSLITSLLYRNGPEQLKLILVDPKRVELTLYKDIPHLLTPVITSAKKALLALKWAAKEMDRRYEVLEEYAKQNIEGYHSQVLAPALDELDGSEDDDERAHLPESMPYIVIIIDEMADLMSEFGKELEPSIVRIAQKARAVGIHLVLSTQRPSVNVITGNIKANILPRIALNVPSLVDSRTILDIAGAEKLLGKGDMLFKRGDSPKPVRLQSPFTSEEEIKKVVSYLKKKHQDDVPNLIDFSANTEDSNVVMLNSEEDSDPLYEQARFEVIQAKKASTSYLQRRLRIGYSRAARLMDELERKGVIGPPDGSKPRPVIGDGEGGVEDEAEEVVLNPLPKTKKGELLEDVEEDEEYEEEEYEEGDEESEEDEEEYEDEEEVEEEDEDEGDGDDVDEEEEDEEEDSDELYSSR